MKKVIYCFMLLTSVVHGESTFNEVRDALFNPNPVPTDVTAQNEILVYQRGALPSYRVTTASFFRAGINLLARDSQRTIRDKTDVFPRIEKLLHPNGVCMTGEWQAVNNAPYTGLFENGKKALMVVRVSTALSATRAGARRGFGIVGKVFPTLDPNQKVKPAHFFTVDVLMGTTRPRFLGVTTTNNPPVGSVPLNLINFALTIRRALTSADKELQYREVYELSEAGLSDPRLARTPKFIKVVTRGPVVNEPDFRNELNFSRHHPNGLTFEVFGNDVTNVPTGAGWVKLANMVLKESVVSYGCDRQVHFAHPVSR